MAPTLPDLSSQWKVGEVYNLSEVINGSYIYPSPKHDVHANLTLLANNTITLDFTRGGHQFPLIFPILAQLIDRNVTRGSVVCAYPLSGQYDHLARYLFYVACVVAVLGRKISRVAEVALNIIVVYTSVSAIHLFVLLGLYDFGQKAPISNTDSIGYALSQPDVIDASAYGDPDVVGIAPAIAIAVVLIVPMLSWSSTFRTDGRSVMLRCWAVLMFAAMIPILVLLHGFFKMQWTFDQPFSMVYCTNTSRSCQAPIEVSTGFGFYTWRDQYDRCGCHDFCGVLSPQAPLRSGTSMVPVLYYDIAKFFLKPRIEKALHGMEIAMFVFFAMALVRGSLALLHSHASPRAVRNAIFHVCNSTPRDAVHLIFRKQREDQMMARLHIRHEARPPTRLSKVRRYAAAGLAGSYYLVSMSALLLYPLLFVATIYLAEVVLATVPTSERSSSLGAWSPWAAAGLILLGFVIQNVYPSVEHHTCRLCERVRYTKEDRPLVHDGRVGLTRTIFSSSTSFMSRLHPSHLVYYMKLLAWLTLNVGIEFWMWARDPQNHSGHVEGSHSESHSALGQEHHRPKPTCQCPRCKSRCAAKSKSFELESTKSLHALDGNDDIRNTV